MTENEIKNAIKTINAQLENALKKEKETEGTENSVFWHLVANDYKCAIKALEEIQHYQIIGTVEECQKVMTGDDSMNKVIQKMEIYKSQQSENEMLSDNGRWIVKRVIEECVKIVKSGGVADE